MIDHITVSVSDLTKSRLFYQSAFAPLGYTLKEKVFWAFDIGNGCLFEIQQADSTPPLTRVHVAFRAGNRRRSSRSIKALLQPARGTMAHLARARTTRPIIMPALSSIPMATISKP